jgi:hypothetical protein
MPREAAGAAGILEVLAQDDEAVSAYMATLFHLFDMEACGGSSRSRL